MNNKTILQEAFKKFELLEEETFHLDGSEEAVEDAKEFMDAGDALDMLDVIDPEAETEEEVEDSYTDKVILDCNVCHSKIYKDPSEIKVCEEDDCVNKDEECPFCYSMDGYKIIGQVKPFVETDIDITVEPKEEEEQEEEPEDVEVEEKEEEEEVVTESLENVDVETEHDKIHIEAEEKVESDEEMIAPLEPEVEDEIEDSQEEEEVEEESEEETEEEPEEDEEEIEYDVDDFDEETFDGLGESYLKRVYENVNSFKTTSVTEKGNKWIVEGKINFKSGNTKPTKFIFEAFSANKYGKLNFIGENAQISRGKKSFKLSGAVDNKKFFAESLNYNYRQKDASGKSVRVYGTVKR